MVHRIFELDESSPVPLYEQLVEQVALAVAAGRLAPGDSLPSVRTLAAELRVNPNTAARALREMERAGLAEAHRGIGTAVAPGAADAARERARGVLRREVAAVVDVGLQLGLSLEELEAALGEHWKEATDGDRG